MDGRAGFVFCAPPHLVALAEGAPHDVADELRSHAALLHNRFIAPLVDAPSPSALDARVELLLEPFGAYLVQQVMPLLDRVLRAGTPALAEAWNRTGAPVPPELQGPPPWLDPLNADDIAWAADVFAFGVAGALADLPPMCDLLPGLAQEVTAGVATDPELRRMLRVSLLLGVVLDQLASGAAPRSAEPFDRACELLYEDATLVAAMLETRGVDWRSRRDAARGGRARRVERYAEAVFAGMTPSERTAVRAARLPSDLLRR